MGQHCLGVRFLMLLAALLLLGPLAAAEEGDEHQAAFRAQRLDVAGDVIAADHVENDVDALAAGQLLDHGDEVFRAVVDGALGAELDTGGAFGVGAGGGEHPGAPRMGDLDRRRADA